MTAPPFSPHLHVERRGPSTGTPLVLVHGFGASLHSWHRWVPRLEKAYPLHLVDLMGFGAAPTPRDGDYSPVAQGRYLADYLAGLGGGPRPVLVGHSLGGAVVLLACLELLRRGAATGPAATGRLPLGLFILSGAVFPQPFPPYISLARMQGIGEVMLSVQPPAWAIRLGLRGIVHDPSTVDEVQVRGYRAPLADPARRRAIVRASRQILPASGEDLSARYREIPVPLLAICGEEDPVVSPADARRLAHLVPRGEVILLPGVGHLPAEEAPEQTVAILKDFVRRLEGTEAGAPS